MAGAQRNSALDPTQVRNTKNLWYKLNVLLYDIRTLREKLDAEFRLESLTQQAVDATYSGLPYLTIEEAILLKNIPVEHERAEDAALSDERATLETFILKTVAERPLRSKKRRDATQDYRLCAAHDLAPILETVSGIKHKELTEDTQFLALVEAHGLNLGDSQWQGVTTKRRVANPLTPMKKDR